MKGHLSIMQIEVNFLNEKEERTGTGCIKRPLFCIINQISRRETVGDTLVRLNATQTCP